MAHKWFGCRALVSHALVILIVGGCSIAAWWQFDRAAQGNTLSYLYSVEWPVFAIVAIVGWWQLIQEKPEEVEARKEERRRRGRANPVAFDAEVLRRELAAHPELVQQFPQLTRAYPELGAPAEQDDRGGGGAPSEVGAADGDVPLGASRQVQDYNDMLAAYAARGKAKTWRNPRGR